MLFRFALVRSDFCVKGIESLCENSVSRCGIVGDYFYKVSVLFYFYYSVYLQPSVIFLNFLFYLFFCMGSNMMVEVAYEYSSFCS